MKFETHKLKYSVWDPRVAAYGATNVGPLLHAYKAWKTVWQQEYRQLGSTKELILDEMIRHDIVCSLMYGEQPVAAHLYSFYDLSSPLHRETNFIRTYFDELSIQKCLKRGSKVLMSLEYLTVMPDFRRSLIGMSMVDLMTQLGLTVYRSTHATGAVACTRNTRRIDQTAVKFKFERVRESFLVNNEPSDLFVYFGNALSSSGDPIVDQLAVQLWNQRADYRLIDANSINLEVPRVA